MSTWPTPEQGTGGATPGDPLSAADLDGTASTAAYPTTPIVPPAPTSAGPGTAGTGETPAASTGPVEGRRRGPRPTTVVWGMLVIAVGVLVIIATTGAAVDLQLAAIIGLGSAGLLLLLTALISAGRSRRR